MNDRDFTLLKLADELNLDAIGVKNIPPVTADNFAYM